jgi:glycosyltransferase involved in cell wall biosynthesis
MAGLEWIRGNRHACSKAARARAEEYSWPKIIERYANLYREVYDRKQAEKQAVAVIISNYNYSAYLAEAIQSVLAQTRKPDEIIVVDDGSTDNSRDIALSFGSAVKLISQQNAGVANARNTGITASKSSLIVCLDADDRLDRRYIESLLPAFTNDRALGVAWSKVAHITDEGPANRHGLGFQF